MTKAWVLTTILLLGACGGGESPAPPADVASPGLEATSDAQTLPADGAPPTSGRFQLNTHYERLSPTQPTSSGPEQVEVAEIFWYGCVHCYAFDSYLKQWESAKPAYVNFVRVPAVWNPLVQLHARAFYTAEALGKGDEMHDAFFAAIHENGNLLDSEQALTEFFGRFGVEAEAFKTAFDSFDVHTKLQRADELNRRYAISSVPTIVVNGKYKTNATLAGSYEQLIALIDELAASERPAD